MNTTSVVRVARGLIPLGPCQAPQLLFLIFLQRSITAMATFSVAEVAAGMPTGPTYCIPEVAVARDVLAAQVAECIKFLLTAMATQRQAVWMLVALGAGIQPDGTVAQAALLVAPVQRRPMHLVLVAIRLRKMATT
ncbi:hypothetical protein A1395_02345 [Pseudomonas protegens]|nr:hypothetical protein A1348_07075 [Pseudomonas protegens]PNG39512.1 hypothetical protein A1395_02345 [Pseudomonas protegens]